MNLEFVINNQILKRIDSQDVVSKNHNIYKCRFIFEEDSDWDDVNKFVIFTDGWGSSTTVHLGKSSNILTCLVPDNVLKGSYFKISVYGGDLLTTNNVSVSLIESGYMKHKHSGCNKHHKDVFVEIFDRLDSAIDSAVYENHCIHLFSRDSLIESVYLPFIDETEIAEIVSTEIQNYLDSHETGLLTPEDRTKLDSVEPGANRTLTDDSLDPSSTNPISNRAVADALNGKEDSYDYIERMDDLILQLIENGDN